MITRLTVTVITISKKVVGVTNDHPTPSLGRSKKSIILFPQLITDLFVENIATCPVSPLVAVAEEAPASQPYESYKFRLNKIINFLRDILGE